MGAGGKRVLKYVAGDHWVICQRSGFAYRRSQMVREEKTGYWVAKSEEDKPHPQQYRTPIKPDRQAVDLVQPNLFNRIAGTGGELPDGTISALPEIFSGSIDGTAVNFLGTNEVSPDDY